LDVRGETPLEINVVLECEKGLKENSVGGAPPQINGGEKKKPKGRRVLCKGKTSPSELDEGKD